MDPVKIVEAAIDSWNGKDEQAFVDLFRPDAEITGPGGMVLQGADGARAFWQGYQGAFPDNRVVARAVFGAGDQAVEEAAFEGTHTAALVGADGTEVPPTGRRVSVPFTAVYGLRDGRVATYHLYFDQVELLTQLGLMPGPTS
ncbi:ester cyclase [Pseudonocardia sp.]|uniref:ester cyclase n=1 Tax=Pseudonocardia sp. TaxID=60912 RepID=UPI003D126BC1